jgi:hypothetical protein
LTFFRFFFFFLLSIHWPATFLSFKNWSFSNFELPIDVQNSNINIVLIISFLNVLRPRRDVRLYLLLFLLLLWTSTEIAVIDGDTFFPPTFESINYCHEYTEEVEQRTIIMACVIIKSECKLRGPNAIMRTCNITLRRDRYIVGGKRAKVVLR